jgi:ABC-2 type transport system permease protein
VIRDNSIKVLAISAMSTRRLLRDRSSLFFLLVFPLLLVLVLGTVFGTGAQLLVGVTGTEDDPLAREIVGELEDGEIDLQTFDDVDGLRRAVERGEVVAGVAFPEAFSTRLYDGHPTEIRIFSGPDMSAAAVRPMVDAAVAPTAGRVQAGWFTNAQAAGPDNGGDGSGPPIEVEEAIDLAGATDDGTRSLAVRATTVGDEIFPSSMGRFDLSASTQLVLFVFINGLASSAVLIQSRQLGVSRRMVSTPTSARVVIVGEMMSRLAVTVFQGLYIMGATWLLFRVDWGDPVGAVAVIGVFGLVPACAGMLLGATLHNDQQATGISVICGLGLAALGGSMVPIELFSPTMERIAHLTPHAWANAAFGELVRNDGGLIDIAPELSVLAAMAAALLALATWRLRKVLTAG